jgi:hypothetical protein
MANSGLLDFLNSPGGMGLLSAVGAGLAGARRGGTLNALGSGLLGGVQGFAQGQNLQQQQQFNQQRGKLFDAQVAESEAQVKARQLAAERQQTRDTFLSNAFTPQPMMQPSKDQAAMSAGNPYANPDFLYQTAQANKLPGLDQVPMGMKPINRFDAIRANFTPAEAMDLESLSAPKKPNIQTFKPGETVRNMDTGEVVFQAPDKPAEAPSAVREYQFATGQGFKGSFQDWVLSQKRAGASSVSVNMGQKGLDNEFKLRDGFKGEPVYKAHQEMQSAYSQIRQSLGQATPAGDLAGATKIMKLLDPGSVVRESELGMAMAATGLLDRAQNYANMVITGQKLTPTQRKEFQQLADALYGESVSQFNAKRSEYERLGGEYGLNAGRALGPNAAGVAPKSQAPKPVNGKPSVSNW